MYESVCVCVLIFRPIEIPYNSFIPPEMNTNKDFCLQTPFYWNIREHNNNNYMKKKSTKFELIVRCVFTTFIIIHFVGNFGRMKKKRWFPITMCSLVPLFSNSIRKWHSFFSVILWVYVSWCKIFSFETSLYGFLVVLTSLELVCYSTRCKAIWWIVLIDRSKHLLFL